jgi:hypothetical protein
MLPYKIVDNGATLGRIASDDPSPTFGRSRRTSFQPEDGHASAAPSHRLCHDRQVSPGELSHVEGVG